MKPYGSFWLRKNIRPKTKKKKNLSNYTAGNPVEEANKHH